MVKLGHIPIKLTRPEVRIEERYHRIAKIKIVEMVVQPAKRGLDYLVQLAEGNVFWNQQTPPGRRFDLLDSNFDLIDVRTSFLLS